MRATELLSVALVSVGLLVSPSAGGADSADALIVLTTVGYLTGAADGCKVVPEQSNTLSTGMALAINGGKYGDPAKAHVLLNNARQKGVAEAAAKKVDCAKVADLVQKSLRSLMSTTPSKSPNKAVGDISAVKASVSGNIQKVPPSLNFKTGEEARAWLSAMSENLASRMPERTAREEFLITVHHEASRAGLNPQLVLGFIDVVSGFRKYKVAENGAKGYMQVHPKWLKLLGTTDDNLFQLRTNLRYGCVILRHYLDRGTGDLYAALIDYAADILPGSEGAQFVAEVEATWQTRWKYPI